MVKLGSDPEIFVTKGNGDLLYAFNFLKDRGDHDYKTSEGNSVYPDGFQAEFNVTPSEYVVNVVRSLKEGLKTTIERARKVDPKARLSALTVVPVDLAVMKTLPLKYTEFGCMPSFNVYGIAGCGGNGPDTPYRFGGGHIHIGDPDLINKEDEVYNLIVKNLDVLGLAATSLAENIDDPIRRQYYGLAGEYRKPPHGLEYRVLSNFWCHSPVLATVILQLAKNIVEYSKVNKTLLFKEQYHMDIVDAIISTDAEKARKLLHEKRILLERMSGGGIDFFTPVEKSIPGIDNIERNWGI